MLDNGESQMYQLATRKSFGYQWRRFHDMVEANREHFFYFTLRTLRKMIAAHTCLTIVYLRSRNLSIAALRSMLWRKPEELGNAECSKAEPAQLKPMEQDPLFQQDQVFRRKIESSRVLRALKAVANKALD